MAEAREIAEAYVRAFHRRRTWRFPRLWFVRNDYRSGWMCYQWQTITYNELEPVVSGGKCFDIERVGLITGGYTRHYCHRSNPFGFVGGTVGTIDCCSVRIPRQVQHNWVAISAVKNETASIVDDVPYGSCTVYLDPWLANGPGVFSCGDHPQAQLRIRLN